MSLNIENSYDLIVNSVRNSHLNFSMQVTSFSLYLTIRKSFAKFSKEAVQIPTPDKSVNDLSEALLNDEIKTLKLKLSDAEDFSQRFKCERVESVNDNEECHKKIGNLKSKILKYKTEQSKRESDLETNWKVLKIFMI